MTQNEDEEKKPFFQPTAAAIIPLSILICIIGVVCWKFLRFQFSRNADEDRSLNPTVLGSTMTTDL